LLQEKDKSPYTLGAYKEPETVVTF